MYVFRVEERVFLDGMTNAVQAEETPAVALKARAIGCHSSWGEGPNGLIMYSLHHVNDGTSN